jgi:hypothetical protein
VQYGIDRTFGIVFLVVCPDYLYRKAAKKNFMKEANMSNIKTLFKAPQTPADYHAEEADKDRRLEKKVAYLSVEI